MDCVKACPHDNVAIYAMSPMREVSRDPLRSSIRKLSLRVDIAMVMLAIALAAFLNAAAMIQPGAASLARAGLMISSRLQPVASLGATFLLGTVVAALAWSAAMVMRSMLPQSAGEAISSRHVFCRFALSLIPLGLGMWAAHLLFHFVTTMQSAWPLLQQFANDSGSRALGHPLWSSAMAGVSSQSLLPFQLFLLDAGLVLSLYAAWRVAKGMQSSTPRALRLVSPWAAGMIALYAFGFWVLLQPMQMRGMMMQG